MERVIKRPIKGKGHLERNTWREGEMRIQRKNQNKEKDGREPEEQAGKRADCGIRKQREKTRGEVMCNGRNC